MKSKERKPNYAMRKLSVGLVSCMLGFALIAEPSHSLAAGGEDGEEVATEVEEELEDTPTELENDEGKDNLNSEDLELEPEIQPESLKEGEESDIHKFNFRWKAYDDSKPEYDENHKNEKVKLKVELRYSGDNRTRKNVFTDEIEFTLGEDKNIEIDLAKYAKKTGLDNPKFSGAYLVATEESNNYKFALGNDTTQDSKVHTYLISQNMDTSINEEKEKDAIILEEDEDKLDVNYKIVEYEKDGKNEDGTYNFSEESKDKTVRRKGEDIPLIHERKFEDGKEFKLAWEEGIIGGSINRNSELDLFARNGKDRKFGILADFKDGIHKKYYTLKIEGDDLEGWTVTLGSKLRKKTEFENIQEQEYKIIRIEDPNLDFGEEVVDREGENGKTADVYETIYLPGEGGEDEVVVPKKLVEKNRRIKEIVNKIIRIGTKKKTPDTPIIPGDSDEEIPEDQEDLTPEERDELDKLIQDLLDEINKEEETPDTKPEDTKKPTENEEVKPSGNEEIKPSENEETKKPEKEEDKKGTADPVKTKPAEQKANKNASPKTGVTGSATIAALGLSSLFASLGLRKKND